jgi:hypothetical protein
MSKITEATIGKGESPASILGIEGAQKVVAEFQQEPKVLTHFLFVDSGKRGNLQRSGILFLFVSILAIGAFFFRGALIWIVLLDLAIASALFALLYRRLFKEAKENFPKEKCFLTEKNLIVQHSLASRAVKFIDLIKVKRIEQKKTLAGDLSVLVYMDAENIAEKREPLFFPHNLAQLEALALDAGARAREEKEKKDKEKEEKEKEQAQKNFDAQAAEAQAEVPSPKQIESSEGKAEAPAEPVPEPGAEAPADDQTNPSSEAPEAGIKKKLL